MPVNKARQKKQKVTEIARRSRVLIGVALFLSLAGIWAMLVHSGIFESAFSREGKNRKEVSAASFNSNSPSKEYIYAGGRLVTTEEPVSSGCGSPPPSPGNTLVATAQSTTSVVLNWAASAGADHYEVQRRQNIGSSWATLSPTPATNSLTDNGVVTSTTYLYQVRAVDASGACPSAFSNVDLATTVVFTDDPLSAGLVIKAAHLTQLRTAVNAVRATANLSQVGWTDPLPQGVPIRAQHMLELRSNLNPALTALGMATVSNDSSLAVGNPIRAVHLQDVRDKVK